MGGRVGHAYHPPHPIPAFPPYAVKPLHPGIRTAGKTYCGLRRLLKANTVEEKEVLLVRTAIHGLQRDFRHTLAELGASPASNDGLELLEVRHDNDIRAMRLLLDALEEARPLPVVILACFVRKDEVNTPQCRRRRPAHFLALARAFVVENAMDSVRKNVAIYKV